MRETGSSYVPVTFDRCDHIEGPFYHGTKFTFEVAEELVPGQVSNFQEGRVSHNIYFTALVAQPSGERSWPLRSPGAGNGRTSTSSSPRVRSRTTPT